MNSYEHPFNNAADDALFAAYMSSAFFDLPSEEADLADSGCTHSAVPLNDATQATIQVQSMGLSPETSDNAVGEHECCGTLAINGAEYLAPAITHVQENTRDTCDSMSRPPSVFPYVPGPVFSPPRLLASIAQEGQTASASFPTTSKKRPASNAVRAGRLSAPKRIRTSKDGWSESRQPPSAADPLQQPESALEHEGNALINHTIKSSTSSCEDNVLADGKVPDTVTVLGQGLPPSRPAKKTRKGKQTPYLTTEFNCHICKTGSARLPDLEHHNRAAEHAKQARQRGIEVVIEVDDSLKCSAPRCNIVKPYSRRDALMRHMREKYPRVPIPRT